MHRFRKGDVAYVAVSTASFAAVFTLLQGMDGEWPPDPQPMLLATAGMLVVSALLQFFPRASVRELGYAGPVAGVVAVLAEFMLIARFETEQMWAWGLIRSNEQLNAAVYVVAPALAGVIGPLVVWFAPVLLRRLWARLVAERGRLALVRHDRDNRVER